MSHISQQIKVQWQPSSILAIHWDGKLIKSLETKNKEERIPILVSGVNGVKLLGVPNVFHDGAKLKFGEKIPSMTMELLEDWQCVDNVKAMVFDTTASNTGMWTAACVKIQYTSSAPINDITLLKSFMEYKSIHLGVATTATRAFESHLWYLTEKLVPLSLFSNSIDEPCKEQLKDKMITCRGTASSDINSKRRGHAFGKPIFPSVDNMQKLEISNFVGVESWRLFRILGLNTDFFMSVSVCDWSSCESFLNAKNVINGLRVVNYQCRRKRRKTLPGLHRSVEIRRKKAKYSSGGRKF